MACKLRIFLREVSRFALSRDFMFAGIYRLYKQKKAVEATLLWYKTHGGDIPNFEKGEIDLFGSEAKQFFEVTQGTKVGRIERNFNCNNLECNKNQKNGLFYIKKTQILVKLYKKGYKLNLLRKSIIVILVGVLPAKVLLIYFHC